MSEYYSGIKDVPALMGLTKSYLRGASVSYHNLAFDISVEIYSSTKIWEVSHSRARAVPFDRILVVSCVQTII